ncbi:MAG: hypothetical protein EAX86_09095 [Candidatus Heimdallarchaeota archaeon]|nr:hypothetical protein [Candidatus Heimdallarchaeota archaeon]
MAVIHSILGISAIPNEFQILTMKYFGLQVVVSGIYLSYAWISLYYLVILNSVSLYSYIVAIGMLCGALLDFPLGLITDRFGQKKAYCGALSCLLIYYLGLIFAKSAFDLLVLEIIVGVYSALISGSFITWFMNSWELISMNIGKESKIQFNAIMSNINSIKTVLVATMTIFGGFLLNKLAIPPQGIFLLQSAIAGFGILLGIRFLNTPITESRMESEVPRSDRTNGFHTLAKIRELILLLQSRYAKVTIFFLSLSLLGFTSMAFQTLLFTPLLYELTTHSPIFKSTEKILITYTTLSIFLISFIQAGSDFIHAIACRLSGRIFNNVISPYRILIVIYSLIYPVVWLFLVFLLSSSVPKYFKLIGVISIYLIRLIIVGLISSLYWQFYMKITIVKIRSSQESLFNTIYLVVSVLGFALIGIIIERFSLESSLLSLFIISTLGIFLLIIGDYAEISIKNN